ncbi:MAG TPA: adenylate/guanylate cyclase domain-containing protein [Acidobacteriaceae bacterium]|jgi:class 3 adenylate cyclase
MGTRTWNKDRAGKRIEARLAELPAKDVEIREYVRDTDLTGLPMNVAYRVDGVHLYADILNVSEMLNVTSSEGETCHKRTLRFLNLHYRAVYRILQRTESIFVDFHNQRLHSVVAKPYDSEAARVRKSVAIAQLIIDVLAQTGEDADHPSAKVRVGIDTGKALAVNNGRRGHREPLFLGEPANHAAKRAMGGDRTGIYLTNKARKAISLTQVPNEDATALSPKEIEECEEKAKLGVTADQIIKEWKEDLSNSPIGSFDFSAHTPPFSTLDLETLSAKNSRRQDGATIYADLDGFTAYVSKNVSDDKNSKHVVRVLHVLRSELDDVLHTDFKGRKVRFIGDCVHGLSVEGTAQTTDEEETISNLTLCSAGMRSSFKLAQEKLKNDGSDASSLGLQIGFEFGPINATRLGMKGELVRCSVSRAVLKAEEEQGRCKADETAIGSTAYAKATEAVRDVFGTSRKRAGLDYPTCVEELSKKNDKAAKAARDMEASLLKPAATVTASAYTFPARRTGPTKPDGFA